LSLLRCRGQFAAGLLPRGCCAARRRGQLAQEVRSGPSLLGGQGCQAAAVRPDGGRHRAGRVRESADATCLSLWYGSSVCVFGRCTVASSVLGAGCTLQAGCTLVNCTVAAGYSVPAGSKAMPFIWFSVVGFGIPPIETDSVM